MQALDGQPRRNQVLLSDPRTSGRGSIDLVSEWHSILMINILFLYQSSQDLQHTGLIML